MQKDVATGRAPKILIDLIKVQDLEKKITCIFLMVQL